MLRGLFFIVWKFWELRKLWRSPPASGGSLSQGACVPLHPLKGGFAAFCADFDKSARSGCAGERLTREKEELRGRRAAVEERRSVSQKDRTAALEKFARKRGLSGKNSICAEENERRLRRKKLEQNAKNVYHIE